MVPSCRPKLLRIIPYDKFNKFTLRILPFWSSWSWTDTHTQKHRHPNTDTHVHTYADLDTEFHHVWVDFKRTSNLFVSNVGNMSQRDPFVLFIQFWVQNDNSDLNSLREVYGSSVVIDTVFVLIINCYRRLQFLFDTDRKTVLWWLSLGEKVVNTLAPPLELLIIGLQTIVLKVRRTTKGRLCLLSSSVHLLYPFLLGFVTPDLFSWLCSL